MKKLLGVLYCSFMLPLWSCEKQWGEDPVSIIDPVKVAYPIRLEDLQGRDPFVFTDEATKTYYLTFNNQPHFRMYSSRDLQNWKDEGYAFTAGSGFWGTQDFWAPDLYQYQNKYYLFATFSAPSVKRGTSILVADKPVGPYTPLVNKAATPGGWMSLDGTLYIDENGLPWMVFCREWLEVNDGEIWAQRLSEDLKTTIGDPVKLLTAAAAPWTGAIRSGNTTGYVTDAPFLFKTKDHQLQMVWSSFNKKGNYAIGVAVSESGTISGPWKHLPEPLNDDDGGHAMIFTDFSGQRRIAYHAPNTGTPKPRIFTVTETNGTVVIEK